MTAATPVPDKKSKPRKFFVLAPDQSAGMHDLELVNKGALTWPGGMWLQGRHDGSGHLDYPETPQLAFTGTKRKGRLPRDLDAESGLWLVSERLKQAFESVDPDGFAFAACDFTLPDGSKGPQYYLCDVVRELDALDEGKSRVKIKTGDEWVGGKAYDLSGSASLVFKDNTVGSAHIFRMVHRATTVVCDSILRDACKAMEPKLNGLWFIDATNY